MRPHLCEVCCVVELCVFVYSLITMCPVMYGRCGCVLTILYVTLVVLIMMCTNPYRMEGPH